MELSKLQQEYRDFFISKLEEFEVNSPAELKYDEKIEFFNNIKKEWKKHKKKMQESMDINKKLSSILENWNKKKIKEAKDSATDKKSLFRKFFNQKLDDYGVVSPNDLSDNEKAEFFDSIRKGWKKFREDSYALLTTGDKQQITDAKELLKGSEEINEETNTSDIAVPAKSLTKAEKNRVSEICKSRGYKMLESKINKKGEAEFLVERYGKKDTIIYNDNKMDKPFIIGKEKEFTHLQNALDYLIISCQKQDQKAKIFLENQKRNVIKLLEEDKKFQNFKGQKPESYLKRKENRSIELLNKFIDNKEIDLF